MTTTNDQEFAPTAEDRERAKLQDRIEELEKNLSYEVEQKIKLADTLRDERAKRPDLPCDGGCNVNDGPMEDCSQHGRNPRDLWGIIEDLNQRLAAERAKRPNRGAVPIIDPESWGWGHCIACGSGAVTHRGMVLLSVPDTPTLARIAWCEAEECIEDRKLTVAFPVTPRHVEWIDSVLALEPEAREETGPALRIDDDGAHIYWADPLEGCWVAFKRVDCVGEEELPERRLPAPEAREVTDV